MGAHEVLKMSPNADGTHSFTANDFIRGDSGAAILTSDTDVWTLLDDVPFGTVGTTDSVQQNVIRTTGYVEIALEASPRPGVDAWGIQIHGQYDADGTGADSCTLKENDGGTLRDVYTNADVSETTAEVLISHCQSAAPSGGAYTQAKLDALRLRWGFAGDVTGSPIVHALMVEAVFPIAGGPTIVEAVGSAAGVATVASVAAAIWNGVTAAAGLATSAVAGVALWLAVATAPGVATGSAASATVLEGVGAAVGVAAASGVGALVLPTQGASAGAAVGTADGADGAAIGSDATATGSATASAIGAAAVGAPASSAGAATVLASSATIKPATGAAAGTAAASGAGTTVLAGAGSAAGIGTAAAVTGAVASTTGSSVGIGAAAADGEDAAVQQPINLPSHHIFKVPDTADETIARAGARTQLEAAVGRTFAVPNGYRTED
jgi:hypothetical protein